MNFGVRMATTSRARPVASDREWRHLKLTPESSRLAAFPMLAGRT
jgi:hypothetical protein